MELRICGCCGFFKKDEDLVRISEHAVCSECRPLCLQAVRQGTPPPRPRSISDGIYKYHWNGHEIKLEHICTVQTLWMASFGYLHVDGRLVAPPPPPFAFRSRIEGTIEHQGVRYPLEMLGRSCQWPIWPMTVEFELLIAGQSIDTGRISMRFRFLRP